MQLKGNNDVVAIETLKQALCKYLEPRKLLDSSNLITSKALFHIQKVSLILIYFWLYTYSSSCAIEIMSYLLSIPI